MSQFSGTTLECLNHYGESFSKKSDAIRELAQVLGSPVGTISKWFYDNPNPNGNRLIKLRYFLEEKGYSVSELNSLRKLRPEVYRLGHLVAKGVLSVEEIAAKMNYPYPENVYGLLRGEWGTGEERLVKARELCRNYLSTEYGLLSDCQGVEDKDDIEKNSQRQVRQNLIALIKACAPLVALVASDDFPVEERKLIRSKIGNEVFFEFSNNVFRIAGGETTRGLMKGAAR